MTMIQNTNAMKQWVERQIFHNYYMINIICNYGNMTKYNRYQFGFRLQYKYGTHRIM